MFNYGISIAAFGFVAFILAFVHPASQTGRAAAQQAAAVSGADMAIASPADGRPQLAVSK
jgi:hypothetical protein